MTPRDFALYDFLNCAAIAVDEAESGRPREAEAAWLEACFAASGLFTPCSAANAAVSVIIPASAPACSGGAGRAVLWKVLSAAAAAALPAMAGNRDGTEMLLACAWSAVAILFPAYLRDAVTTLLAEIQRMAEAGVTA